MESGIESSSEAELLRKRSRAVSMPAYRAPHQLAPSAAQPRQYRQHATVIGLRRRQSEPGKDARHVLLDRAVGDIVLSQR